MSKSTPKNPIKSPPTKAKTPVAKFANIPMIDKDDDLSKYVTDLKNFVEKIIRRINDYVPDRPIFQDDHIIILLSKDSMEQFIRSLTHFSVSSVFCYENNMIMANSLFNDVMSHIISQKPLKDVKGSIIPPLRPISPIPFDGITVEDLIFHNTSPKIINEKAIEIGLVDFIRSSFNVDEIMSSDAFKSFIYAFYIAVNKLSINTIPSPGKGFDVIIYLLSSIYNDSFVPTDTSVYEYKIKNLLDGLGLPPLSIRRPKGKEGSKVELFMTSRHKEYFEDIDFESKTTAFSGTGKTDNEAFNKAYENAFNNFFDRYDIKKKMNEVSSIVNKLSSLSDLIENDGYTSLFFFNHKIFKLCLFGVKKDKLLEFDDYKLIDQIQSDSKENRLELLRSYESE